MVYLWFAKTISHCGWLCAFLAVVKCIVLEHANAHPSITLRPSMVVVEIVSLILCVHNYVMRFEIFPAASNRLFARHCHAEDQTRRNISCKEFAIDMI